MDLQFSGLSVPTKAYVNDSKLAILGREFTGQTDAILDGRSTARVVLHHNNNKVVTYEKARGSESAVGGLSAPALRIFSVAYESDLEDSADEEGSAPPAPVSSPVLRKLLSKWKHLGTDIGCTDLVQHIKVYIKSGTKPVNVRSCRKMAVKQMDAVRKAIDDMLSMGVIEESISKWCSAIVLVPKKDGSIRIAIDYRGVNELTEKDAYPMPRKDVIIERLASAKIFSKLDLTKGYYQVSTLRNASSALKRSSIWVSESAMDAGNQRRQKLKRSLVSLCRRQSCNRRGKTSEISDVSTSQPSGGKKIFLKTI